MFQFNQERDSESSEVLLTEKDNINRKISKRKQNQLLANLNMDEVPVRLRQHTISKS